MPADPKLPWTGERLVPEYTGDTAIEHLHRYAFACEFVERKVVLDIASGEGYGSRMLSKVAARVIGIDISSEAVEHAQRKYGNDKLAFEVGSCLAIPLPNHSVDVVVSFETLEHVFEHDTMLTELKRVLQPDGVLIISTPDKLHYTVLPRFTNEHHAKELFKDEFADLMARYFSHCLMFDQNIVHGSILTPRLGAGAGKMCQYFGNYDQLTRTNGITGAPYNIAVATDIDLEFDPFVSLFCGWNIPTELEKQLADARTSFAEAQSLIAAAQAQAKVDARVPAETRAAQAAEIGRLEAALKRADELEKHLAAAQAQAQIDGRVLADSRIAHKAEIDMLRSALTTVEERSRNQSHAAKIAKINQHFNSGQGLDPARSQPEVPDT